MSNVRRWVLERQRGVGYQRVFDADGSPERKLVLDQRRSNYSTKDISVDRFRSGENTY